MLNLLGTPCLRNRHGLLFALALILATGVLAACDSGERTLVEVDSEAVIAEPGFETVRSILDRSCLPCHGGGDRDYSTCAGIIADMRGILDTALDEESMPPGAWPRLSEEEKLIIDRWQRNGACAPCNPCP